MAVPFSKTPLETFSGVTGRFPGTGGAGSHFGTSDVAKEGGFERLAKGWGRILPSLVVSGVACTVPITFPAVQLT